MPGAGEGDIGKLPHNLRSSAGFLRQPPVAGLTRPGPGLPAGAQALGGQRASSASTSEWNSRRYSTHTTLSDAAMQAQGEKNQATSANEK